MPLNYGDLARYYNGLSDDKFPIVGFLDEYGSMSGNAFEAYDLSLETLTLIRDSNEDPYAYRLHIPLRWAIFAYGFQISLYDKALKQSMCVPLNQFRDLSTAKISFDQAQILTQSGHKVGLPLQGIENPPLLVCVYYLTWLIIDFCGLLEDFARYRLEIFYRYINIDPSAYGLIQGHPRLDMIHYDLVYGQINNKGLGPWEDLETETTTIEVMGLSSYSYRFPEFHRISNVTIRAVDRQFVTCSPGYPCAISISTCYENQPKWLILDDKVTTLSFPDFDTDNEGWSCEINNGGPRAKLSSYILLQFTQEYLKPVPD